MARNTARPLSPHLSIWRWGPHMLVSILHRATGVALSLGGLILLTWWLLALTGEAGGYETFGSWAWADLGTLEWSGIGWSGIGAILVSLVKIAFKVALVGLTWAFFQHTLSGIRHLIMDTGLGFELNTNKSMAWATIAGSLVLTAAFWALLLGKAA